MNMTPSQQVVAQAQQVQVLQDSDGRRITIRRLGALDRLRLFEAAGPVLSGNDRWLGLAALACSVTEIDGVPLPMSASKASVEAAVQRLGDAGIAAIAAALSTPAGESHPGN